MRNERLLALSVLIALACVLPGCRMMYQQTNSDTSANNGIQEVPSANGSNPDTDSDPGTTNDVGKDVSESGIKEQAANNDASIAKEITSFEQERRQIDSEYEADPRLGGNMSQMRDAIAEHAQSLEALMDEFYVYLSGLDSVDSAQLSASQEEWEAGLRAELDEFTEEQKGTHRSGNAMGMDSSGIKVERVNKRLDELFDLAYSLS